MEKGTEWSFGTHVPRCRDDEISHQFYNSPATGLTLPLQQNFHVFEAFSNLLESIKPARILEIGTALGGTTQFLRDKLNEIGLKDSTIKSFEVSEREWFPQVRESGVEIIIENIFNRTYTKLEKPEMIVPYIQEEGTTIVLCDGGNKIAEFNIIAPYLKSNDIIMAHDYVSTHEAFLEDYKNKIWNWREIGEEHIKDISDEQSLQPFMQDEFSKAVWVCKRKISLDKK
jgi:cephalosporin hydroxylase